LKMAFKEFPRPAFALFAEHNRLRLRLRVGDVPPGMETFQRLPVVRLPRSPLTAGVSHSSARTISSILSLSYSMVTFPVRSYTRRLRCETALPGRAGSARSGLNPNPIIDRRPDSLSRSQVLLRSLNRDMSEQKLDLIQFAARIPTEPRTGPSQIVRCKGRNADPRSGRPYYVPYGLFADA